MEINNYCECFKALGDETRVKIIKMLEGGTLCACKILEKFDITQPTLSYHMKMLVECGLVEVIKIGVWNHYSINKDCYNEIKGFFENRLY